MYVYAPPAGAGDCAAHADHRSGEKHEDVPPMIAFNLARQEVKKPKAVFFPSCLFHFLAYGLEQSQADFPGIVAPLL